MISSIKSKLSTGFSLQAILFFPCLIFAVLVAFVTWRAVVSVYSAKLSEAASFSAGPYLASVFYAVDTTSEKFEMIGAQEQDFAWSIVNGDRFTGLNKRGWRETVLRWDYETELGTRELFARVLLKETALTRPGQPDSTSLFDLMSELSERIASQRSEALLQLKLQDNRWIEFSSKVHWRSQLTNVQLSIVLVATFTAMILLLRASTNQIAKSLRQLVEYSKQLIGQRQSKTLPERGSREAREIAKALNKINRDMDWQIQDRTRFLVAISHDLRTPATRMHLRAELIDDEILRQKMLSDVDEMSGMVNAAIGFLRDGFDKEARETILFTSLLESICDDYTDTGRHVTLDGPVPLVIKTSGTLFDPRENTIDINVNRQITLNCQPTRLRRAFNNIIDNAIKYGDFANVTITADANQINVTILDGGKGIPGKEKVFVFEPFYRIEGSRGRSTGGVGLGLSVAKSIIEDHNGSIELGNHHEKGLEVKVVLPRLR